LEQFAPGLGGVAEKAGNEERINRSRIPITHFFMRQRVLFH